MQRVPLGRWSAKFFFKKKGIERICNCTYDLDVAVALSYDRMARIIHDDCAKLNFSHPPLIRGLASGCALANNPGEPRVLEVRVVL